jgi:hypothetical protein
LTTAVDQVPDARNSARAALESVVVATKGDDGWVKLQLRLPSGEVCEGSAQAPPEGEARARGAVMALADALNDPLSRIGIALDVAEVTICSLAAERVVHLRARLYDHGAQTDVIGSAALREDFAAAGARALLQAINRKLRWDRL